MYQIYKDKELECPSTPQEWGEKAVHFCQRWTFHHVVRAICGKHVVIRCFFYKGFYSAVLLALVDADYRFNGCCSDPQIFNGCQLMQNIMDGTIGFPDADLLPGDDRDMPYLIVADDAFALRTWLMKPISGRKLNDQHCIFSYRLSRARRVVENAFRILANHFRCLLMLTTMAKEPHSVTSVVLACVTLQNIIRTCYRADHQGLADEEDNNYG